MASSTSLLPTLLVLLAVAANASAAATTFSCTGEIILFFLNGEAYLGPGCCRAICVIEQRCWAADLMLSVIGFTPEEGDMLKGYCDAGDDGGEGHHHGVGGSSPAPPPHRALDGVASGGTAVPVAGRKGLGAPLDG
ncbi:hypothetical protein VPH35_078399 [Triticum aestivum]